MGDMNLWYEYEITYVICLIAVEYTLYKAQIYDEDKMQRSGQFDIIMNCMN